MTLSKEQRLEAYKQALGIMREMTVEDMFSRSFLGICMILKRTGCIEGPLFLGDEFPEFYAQKPQSVWEWEFWWPTDTIDGLLSRIKALENAIALCEKSEI